jgi:hypothetical protein
VAKIASSPEPKLPEFKLPALKLPKLDLDALFGAQKANLAVVHEAQSTLVAAGQAIAEVQQGYLEQIVVDVRAASSRRAPPKPEAVLAEVKAAAERTSATAKEVMGLAVAAQRRAVELLTQRSRANVDELKAALAA